MNSLNIRSLSLVLVALSALVSISPLFAQDRPAALAPVLVEPYDGKDVVDQQIVWTWFMQSTASDGSDILCDLVVVEILDGQTPEEALRVNPPVIVRQNLTMSTWETPAVVRGLQHGARYAWQIAAKVRTAPGEASEIVNRSEIWTFRFDDPAVATEGREAVVETGADAGASVIDSLRDATSGDTAEIPPAVAVSGTARHTFSSENRRGNLSTAPVRFDRLQVDPTIALFGVPLELSLLVSTEQNLRLSDLSRGAIGTNNLHKDVGLAAGQRIGAELLRLERQRDSSSVDSLRAFVEVDSGAIAERIAQLQQVVDDLEIDPNLEALHSLNLLTPEQETLSRFPSFGFGQVAPNFGSLLFDKVTINGGSLEYNPGNLYLAAAVGKGKREVDPDLFQQNITENDTLTRTDPSLAALDFFRTLYAVRAGFGRRHGSYVALTGMYADDDDQSRSLQAFLNRPVPGVVERFDSSGTPVGIDTVVQPSRVVGRQRNYAIGGVGRLDEKNIGLVLDGEFNLTYFDDDANREAQILVPLPRALPAFLRHDSVLTDFNFALRADWDLPGEESGNLTAGLRYVGGGFRSVGLAGLRTDVLRADARYRTLLFDRQVRIGITGSFEEAGYKDPLNSSRIAALGANLDLRFRGLPAIALSYQRHDQQLETGKLDTLAHRRTDNGIEQLSATVSYLHQWSSMRWSFFASAMVRDGRSKGSDPRFQPDSAGLFRVRSLQLDNRLSFSREVTLGIRAAYSGTRNHPLRRVEDSTGVLFTESGTEESDNYTLDISALLQPMSWWGLTLGVVAAYQREITQPALVGGYIGSQFQLGTIGTVELRFDYRESGAPDLQTTFPVERVGRVITTVRW